MSVSEVFKVYTQDRVQQRLGEAEHFPAATAEHLVDIPVPRGGPVLHLASSSSDCRVRQTRGFFALLPEGKSATLGPHSGSELGADISSSTPAAWRVSSRMQLAGVWMQYPGGWWKLLGSDPEVWRPG